MAGHPKRSATRRNALSLRGDEDAPGGDGSLFTWAVVILLLIGFAIACWIFSFYVFGHPEKPFSYAVLTKLKKLDAPKRFELTQAPRGEFLTAQQLWDRYNKMSNRELQRASETLLRNYLRNYKLTPDPVPYVVGTYKILDSYELTDDNLFTSGVVALAQSADAPQVLLEQVFSADKKVIPILHRMLLTGLDFKLDRNNEISAIINVKRLPDGRLLFTSVPLLYASYTSSGGSGEFSLEPPKRLNMQAGLPVVKQTQLSEAEQKYASHRMRAGLPQADLPRRPQTQLVRVEKPKPVTSGRPEPAATPEAKPQATPEPTPPVAVAVATPLPVEPTPPPPTPVPAAITSAGGGNWQVYAPGQMPRGRLTNIPEMPSLAGRGVSGERIYLQGDFVVTASGQNRAVLRPQPQIAENLGLGERTSNTRVIVEFPAGSRPPTTGTTFSRDSRRPFLITDVRKGADGQVNVYVREITRPE
jgi:Activator of osmoprotectant transporter ProP